MSELKSPGWKRGVAVCLGVVAIILSILVFVHLFIGLIISVVAVNFVVNPILLDRYLKKSKLTAANVEQGDE